MVIRGRIKQGEYFDSVTLMIVGKEIAALEGIIDAAVVMGTEENKSILDSTGLLNAELSQTNGTDLLICVNAESKTAADTALTMADEILQKTRKRGKTASESNPQSMESALETIPDANLVLISVPGRFAGGEAMKALEKGLHVMLFSDNVPIKMEIELKHFARKKGLLVMGPDCGTAIINGVPLGFANAVNRGNIGIVAASGTGLQEASSIISNSGAGISQAIGTGGRDVKKDIGGIMFMEALHALAGDNATEVILLISKPPHENVLNRIEEQIKNINKKIIALFLGADPSRFKTLGVHGATTLEEAALTAVALSKGRDPGEVAGMIRSRDENIKKQALKEIAKRKKKQKYVRGLFSGGTFCTEAQIIFETLISNVYSNVPAGNTRKLKNSSTSCMNTVVDLGEDEFTLGRPHPMMDYSLRKRRILEEAEDPQTAVILLDIVLGFGSHMDPASELFPVVKEVSGDVSVVCSVTGTNMEPQNREAVQKTMESAGAIVMPTNAAACKLAGTMVKLLGDE